jgi:hypothetical protein
VHTLKVSTELDPCRLAWVEMNNLGEDIEHGQVIAWH